MQLNRNQTMSLSHDQTPIVFSNGRTTNLHMGLNDHKCMCIHQNEICRFSFVSSFQNKPRCDDVRELRRRWILVLWTLALERADCGWPRISLVRMRLATYKRIWEWYVDCTHQRQYLPNYYVRSMLPCLGHKTMQIWICFHSKLNDHSSSASFQNRNW